MAIKGIGSQSMLQVQNLVAMRHRLDDLQRQLGTGKRANDYAGIGLDRGLTIGLRTQLTTTQSFTSTTDVIGTRLQLCQTALTDIDAAARVVKPGLSNSSYMIEDTGHTREQITARGQLDRILAALNTRFGDQYVFSGQSADLASVVSLDLILKGDGVRAGFSQVTEERRQADFGSGLGRLLVSAASSSNGALAGTTASLSPDAGVAVTGTTDLSVPLTAGGTLTLNGVAVAINAGDNGAAIVTAINTAMAGAPPGTDLVTASLVGNQLVLQSDPADIAIDAAGSTPASLLADLGLPTDVDRWTNLLTRPNSVRSGQTLTIAIGTNPPLTLTFGDGVGEVSTLAEMNVALAALVGGTASVNPANGNLTVTATSNTNAVGVTGTAAPAAFGLSGARAAVSEDIDGSVFGCKLANVTTTIAGAAVTQPAGVPKSMSIDLSAASPKQGDAVTFTFTMPDGTLEPITLSATTATPPGENSFTIGATPEATAANLRSSLAAATGRLARTSLTAASAIAAANDFFNTNAGNPPRRIAPPFATAVALTAGTAADTVSWYNGEAGAMPARATAVARIDTAITVSYGMRANEEGLRIPVANLAVFAAMEFSTSDADGKERYFALAQRVQQNLSSQAGVQKASDIAADLAGAQSAIGTAKDRHTQTKAALTNLLQNVEGVPLEQVGAEILAMQTSLQASLQAAALLANLSLVNYI